MSDGTRRYHTKTRTGCGQCKKRHVKCDGTSPRCRNCQKRDIECDYTSLGLPGTIQAEPTARITSPHPLSVHFGAPSTSSSASSFNLGSSNTPSITSTSSITLPSLSAIPQPSNTDSTTSSTREIPSFTYTDLQLILHYATSVAPTIGDGTINPVLHENFWIDTVPSAAQKHRFLMHHLLSVSALHLSHQVTAAEPEKRYFYRDLSLRHYSIALHLFRNRVENLSPATFIPVLSAVILTGVVSCGLISEEDNTIDSFLQPLFILRKSCDFFFSTVMNEATPSLLLQILNFANSNPNDTPSAEVLAALANLTNLNNLSNDSAEDKSAYADAIRVLTQSFAFTTHKPAKWERSIFFPRVVSQRFFELLMEKRPLALAVLAHWYVPIHHAPRKWFVKDWGRRSIRTIAEFVGPEWREAALQWPVEQVGGLEGDGVSMEEPVD